MRVPDDDISIEPVPLVSHSRFIAFLLIVCILCLLATTLHQDWTIRQQSKELQAFRKGCQCTFEIGEF